MKQKLNNGYFGVIANCNIINNKIKWQQINKMQPKEEGFDESDDERLESKLQEGNPNNKMANTFFIMPQAKPLLSKNIIDTNKAKVLIKEIDIYEEPKQLHSSNIHRDIFSIDKPHNAKPINCQNLPITTIWDKYILSQNYTLVYLKYYKDSIQQLQSRSFKKFKLQLQKMCNYQTHLFSTYLVDLSFLSDAGTYLLRNLKPTTLQQIHSVPFEGKFKFDSRFECGNLFAVFEKKNDNSSLQQYDLILQSDINSKGYSNWFYFNVRNKNKGVIKYNIVNMQKNHSQFAQGMKVAVFSMKKFNNEHIEWHRDGYGYSYYKNELRKSNQTQLKYNSLSFFYQFKYDHDVVYFAANMPYSYTKMLAYVDSIQKIARLNSNIYFKKETVANSISHNACPAITLTWKRQKRKDQKKQRKKIIGVIARQHPCQTVSSYVMQGFLNSLIYIHSQSAVSLLQNYIFKIVPMVNVDGVVYGNSRCDISGTDINRKWTKNPNKYIYPIVSGVKNMFTKLMKQQYELDYFIDLHGHSRKLGCFIYGCKTTDQFQTRQLSWILSKLNSKFLFEECLFGLSQFKKQTARGVMCDLITKNKSMTLQTSFYGYKSVSSKHFDTKDLQKIGSSLLQSLYADYSKDPKVLNWDTIKDQIKSTLDSIQEKQNNGKEQSNSQSSFGSDSNPEEDQMTEKQKADHYLDPSTALKIGINDVKITKKNRESSKQKEFKKDETYQMIIDGFKQKLELPSKKQQSNVILCSDSDLINPVLKQQKLKQRTFIIRQSKSTTKILPFKFSQRLQKPLSLEKRNRKSVQFLIKRPQKLSMPDLPKIEVKSNFWTNLKKQYEVLISERKISGLSSYK